MNLKYFEELVYDELFREVPQNIFHYTSYEKSKWIEDFFHSEAYFKSSGLTAHLPSLEYSKDVILTNEQKSQQDLVNTRLIFDEFKFLSPLQATTKTLWAYMAHEPYKDYVTSRWIKSPDDEDKKDDIIKTIRNRFFVPGKKELIRYNAISRLWWAGYLTYDENNSDRYHLTKILFTGQQICGDLLDASFCGNKKVIMGILLGLKQYLEENISVANLSGHFRACIKYMRRYAAVTNIDYLDVDEIHQIFYDSLKDKDTN